MHSHNRCSQHHHHFLVVPALVAVNLSPNVDQVPTFVPVHVCLCRYQSSIAAVISLPRLDSPLYDKENDIHPQHSYIYMCSAIQQ